MHSLKALILVVSLFVAAVLSSPTPTQPLQKRSFKHVVRRNINRRSTSAGPDAMLKAYRKWGFQLMSRQATAAQGAAGSSQSGTVAASPEPNEAEYLSPVQIGGQTLNMDFDTGSSDL
jgi:hypothetical protein